MIFQWWGWLVIGLFLVGTHLAFLWGGYYWGRRETLDSVKAVATQRQRVPGSAPKQDSNPLVCPPPMVGNETVMQWAVRTYAGKAVPVEANEDPATAVWSLVVRDFYEQASQYIGVARHFNFTDMPELQRKFTATAIMVFDKGLREGAIKAMGRVHADLGITGPEYDIVAQVLGETMQRYKVPAEAFPAVKAIVDTLRPVIVAKANVA